MFFSRVYRKIKNRLYSFYVKMHVRDFGKKSAISAPATINYAHSICIGKKVKIREFAWLNCYEREDGAPTLQIGDGTAIGRFCHINAYSNVKIERKVLISDRVFITDVHHEVQKGPAPIIDQGVTDPKAVHLKEGCWIGVGVTIMPGITIGKNSIVGAHAVVTKDVPDHAVVAGIPAQIKKYLNTQERTQ